MFGIGKRPFDPKRLDEAWERYVGAIEKGHPGFRNYLAPGANESAIADAEMMLKRRLPDDLRYLLSKHAGSMDERQVLPGWELYSPQRIVDEWNIWEDLRRTEFVPDKVDCQPEPGIKRGEWWRLGWVPFCGDGGGNHLCVDVDPPMAGKHGQVISMWHDDDLRALIAGSLTEFIEIIAADAEKGALHWDDDWGGVHGTLED